jgi:hypothetical protein
MYQPVPLLFSSMARSKCTSLGCGYACLWFEVSVPDCDVVMLLMVRSKFASLCCGYSCLWFKVSVPDCAVGLHGYGSK